MSGRLRFSVAALLACVFTAGSNAAVASVKLELLIHDAARVARSHDLSTLLIVVREDVRSARDLTSAEVLGSIEQIAVQALEREPGVTAVTSQAARGVATQARSRRPLQPAELSAYRSTADFDAVLNFEYRNRGGITVEISLVNSQATLFNDTARLEGRPDADRHEALLAETGTLPDSNASASNAARKPVRQNPSTTNRPNGSLVATGNSGGVAAGGLASSGAGTSSLPLLFQGSAGRVMRMCNRPETGSETAAETTSNGDAQATAALNPLGLNLGNGDGTTGDTTSADPGTGGPPDGRKCRKDGQGDRGQPGTTDGSDGSADGNSDSGDATEDSEDQSPVADPVTDLPELAAAILDFAIDHLGEQVGRGECWDLADQAMRAAGAEPPHGYTFGQQIPLTDIRPGDILQFTAARFDEPNSYTIMGAPNHTAVVSGLQNGRILLLQQNFNGQRFVTPYNIDLDNLTSGTVEAWRPQPARDR